MQIESRVGSGSGVGDAVNDETPGRWFFRVASYKAFVTRDAVALAGGSTRQVEADRRQCTFDGCGTWVKAGLDTLSERIVSSSTSCPMSPAARTQSWKVDASGR